MQSSRRTGVLTLCMALLLAVAGGVLLTLALTRPGRPPSPPSVATGTSTTSSSPVPSARAVETPTTPRPRGVRDLTRGLVLPEAAPSRVTIPRIHVSSRLVRLGVDRTGAMEVPADPARAGWYDLGPTPGALGPSVIAGHARPSHPEDDRPRGLPLWPRMRDAERTLEGAWCRARDGQAC